ncbi:hypothetical protein KUCAC02_000879 [Chaenocephalus aceratus]|uniref:Uncharacterized protein n=1 Tax=Chaenocephalus aceratus TaxID=36190 RepID=A0ACB9XUP4_CHAAC|nr:hypothetical protein KUCAC02_000879 [Chaenocephalus aceratus]
MTDKVRKRECKKVMDPREEVGDNNMRKEKDRKLESPQDVVCVLETLRLEDCLEMATGEMPLRTRGKEMKWR